MQKPVSLYIPCFNVQATIGDCIQGLLKQTYPPDEILVIDDGSSDRTAEIASGYPVKVIRHERNKGLAAARNTGIKNSRNELVAFVDADCIPAPEWLERLVVCLEDEAVALAGGRLTEGVLLSSADRWRAAHMCQHWGESPRRDPEFIFGHDGLVRKSALEKAGWYNETYRTNGEDVDISRRLGACGFSLMYEPAAVVKHLRRDSFASILKTAYRYWWSANFESIYAKKDLASFLKCAFREHLKEQSWRFVKEDVVARRYELLFLDTVLFFYMAYRDARSLAFADRA